MSTEARREIGELLAGYLPSDEVPYSVDSLLHASTHDPAEMCLVGAVQNLADSDFDRVGNIYNDDVRAIISLVYRARDQREQARRFAVACEGEAARLRAEQAKHKAEIRRLRATAEPECLCEHVDIGVGMQKVADNRECPACWPEARQMHEYAQFLEAERDAAVLARGRALAELSQVKDAAGEEQ